MRISEAKESCLDVGKMLRHIQLLWKNGEQIFLMPLWKKVSFSHIDNYVGSSE